MPLQLNLLLGPSLTDIVLFKLVHNEYMIHRIQNKTQTTHITEHNFMIMPGIYGFVVLTQNKCFG